ILESIPAIIERAIESSRTPGVVTDISALRPGVDTSQEKKEKAAALEWLKNQYFQHAHEYVRKGEYQNALAEIRRVYIIDANNKVAQDFEKQIGQLAQLKTQQSTRQQTGFLTVPPIPDTAPVAARQPAQAPESESTPMLTEEWSSPQQLLRKSTPGAQKSKAPPAKKKGNMLLMVLIFLALIILGAAILWYYQRFVMTRHSTDKSSLPPASSEQFIGAPSQANEQSYLVSRSDADSLGATPEVTEIPQSEDPAPKERKTQHRTTPSKAGGTIADVRSEVDAPKEQPETRPTAPPVMATQSAPIEKSPAPVRTPDTASPSTFVAIQKDARIIKLERPKFSALAYQKGVEGQVVIQVQIDPAGKPVQTVVLRSTNDLLIQPIIEAVMSSQFAPAEMTSGPVTAWLTIPFKFSSN
ncbi:MAG TPA: TonB family protein, partial [Bacteroidota bacterium]|nr:TonB family protein [Bacteroidota bacterium]